MRTGLLIVATLIGCGDDAMKAPEQTIGLHAAGTKLLAVQPDGEKWLALSVPADGEVSTTIPDGPYKLVAVCDEPDLFEYYVVFGGPGINDWDLYCKPAASTVKVTLAAGRTRAAIASYPFSGGTSWNIKPGTYDITAFDDSTNPPRFEIRRGVSITA